MVINLKQLYEIPGEKLELDAQVSPERLSEYMVIALSVL